MGSPFDASFDTFTDEQASKIALSWFYSVEHFLTRVFSNRLNGETVDGDIEDNRVDKNDLFDVQNK